MLFEPARVLLFALALASFAILLGAILTGLLGWSRVAPLIAKTGPAVAALSLALLAAGAVRAVGRPSISDRLDRLWASAVKIPPPSSLDTRQLLLGPQSLDPWMATWARPGVVRLTIPDRTVLLSCQETCCRVGVLDGADREATPEDVDKNSYCQQWRETLYLAHDPDLDILYLLGERPVALAEFHRRDGRWVPLGIARWGFAQPAAVPPGWLLWAAGALLVTAVLLRARRAAKERVRALASASTGVLGEDGWIALDGAGAARLDGTTKPSPGPVIVLGAPTTNTAFRDRTLSDRDLLPGPLEPHRRDALRRLFGLDALALVTAVLAAAPLFSGLATGLIVPWGGDARSPISPGPPRSSSPRASFGESEHQVIRRELRPVVFMDVNRDGTDDLVGDCFALRTQVSGVRGETSPCAIDGATLQPLWGPADRPGPEVGSVLGAAGDLVFTSGAGSWGHLVDAATGAVVRGVPLPERSEVCALPERPGTYWIGLQHGSDGPPTTGVELHLLDGALTEAPRPPACHPEGSFERDSDHRQCPSPPTAGEIDGLASAGLTPIVVIHTKEAVLSVARDPEKSGIGSRFAVAMTPRTSAVRWRVATNLYHEDVEPIGAVVTGGRLYVTTRESGDLVSFDVETGERALLRLGHAPARQFVSNGGVYVSTSDGLSMYDRITGARITTLPGSGTEVAFDWRPHP